MTKDYRVVLDEEIPLGEVRLEKTVALVNPESDLLGVLAANPGVKFSVVPRDASPGEGSGNR